MRWPPWSRPEPEGETDVDRYDDALEGDEQDALLDEEGDEEEEEPEFDDSQKAYLEKQVAARASQLAEQQAKAIADLEARHQQALIDLGARMGRGGDRETGRSGEGAPATAAPPEPAEPEMPDPSYDPAGFAKWLTDRDERMAKRIVEQVAPQFQQMRERVDTARTAASATARAKEILGQYGAAQWAEDPAFDQHFEDALMDLPANQRESPQQLLALAAFVRGELGPPPPREPQQPRNPQGQFTPADRAAAARGSLGATAPSQGSGRAPQQQAVTEDERMLIAEYERITGKALSIQEWRGLEEPIPNGYRRIRDRPKQGASR